MKRLRSDLLLAAAAWLAMALPGAQAAVLTASDGAEYNYFGSNLAATIRGIPVNDGIYKYEEFDSFGVGVSLSGSTAVVAAPGDNDYQGAVYVYRGLDTATGTVTENVKLTASDGAAYGSFGYSLSLSGFTAVVAAPGDNDDQGAAYLYRGLDIATGTITENVKLTASDGAAGDSFGYSVSLSGAIALIGAIDADIGENSYQGAIYVYRGLDTATGTVTENVKLTASDGKAYDSFGKSVSLSGTAPLHLSALL